MKPLTVYAKKEPTKRNKKVTINCFNWILKWRD